MRSSSSVVQSEMEELAGALAAVDVKLEELYCMYDRLVLGMGNCRYAVVYLCCRDRKHGPAGLCILVSPGTCCNCNVSAELIRVRNTGNNTPTF